MPDPLLKECHGMTDADYDAEVRFAGAGVLRDDTEYQYPPAKWEGTKRPPPQGAPYEVKSVVSWPAEVDAHLADIDARLRHIEALVHKAINPGGDA